MSRHWNPHLNVHSSGALVKEICVGPVTFPAEIIRVLHGLDICEQPSIALFFLSTSGSFPPFVLTLTHPADTRSYVSLKPRSASSSSTKRELPIGPIKAGFPIQATVRGLGLN